MISLPIFIGLLLVLALVCFILAAANASLRFNPIGAGLALVVIWLLIGAIR